MEQWLKSHCEELLGVQHQNDDLEIVGAHEAKFHFRPTPVDLTYEDRVVVVTTANAHGVCGCPDLNDHLDLTQVMEFSISDAEPIHPCLEVALFDALLATEVTSSETLVTIRGQVAEKAVDRAKLLASLVIEQVGEIKSQDPLEVVLIGAVGSIVAELKGKGFSVRVTEKDTSLIGETVCGVVIEDSSMTGQLITQADFAIVTGMVVVTETLGLVMSAAKRGETPLVFFAQSAANILRTLEFPTPTTIVDEKFPHYMWPGDSDVSVVTGRTITQKP